MRRLPLAVALLLAAGAPMIAEQASPAAKPVPAKFDLTVDNIMRGPDLVGFAPTGVRWSGDSKWIYFEWRKPGEEEASTYVLARAGGEPRRLSDDERKLAPPAGGARDRARRRVLFVDEGDIVLVDSVAGTRRQITRTVEREANPRWARNETHVTFVRDGNLFILPIDPVAGDLMTQLTDAGPKKPDPRLTDSQKYVKAEEGKLIEFVREQAERKRKDEKKQEAASLPKLELSEGQTAADLMLSPDGTRVFALVTERSRAAKAAVVPNYVTESAYTEDIQARTFVGDAQSPTRLAILNLKTKKAVWADSSFAGERKPKAAQAGGSGQETTAEKSGPALREVGWSMPAVSTDGQSIVGYARSLDNKDRWIVLLDPETGKSRVLDWLHDDAWIREVRGGFGGGGVAEFLPDDRRIWFVSEKDGWAHLYTLDVTAAEPQSKQLTSGRWEITSAELAPDKQHFHIVSTEKHPGERHVYSLGLEGGARAKITAQTGSHSPEVSPDGTLLANVHSYSNKPPELYLMKNEPGSPMTQITTTPVEAWRSFAWADPKVLTFKARDGVDVYARLFTPEMLGAKRDPARPGVIFVHGAGYAQNAHRYWASYFREYMFHNLLASRGYVVLDVDYRASSGYGRDWRTAIYRHMGGKDLDDIVDGARYLVTAEKVDPKRIGLYGGSYGGFITLMAMFTAADTFAAGAALRPVTDWAHYNHGYTAGILNQPQDDPEAYAQSSPIYFAQNLKGALLICHGIVDTNVHFQDSVRLVQRLIELRKENWELAVYPVENHGFTEATSWADEYKRILTLFETNLRLRSQR
jgi:dipeptidyl aminopeptidase/acylaminoacyl peptidase